jgi:rhodanese-related sulfurtransferase
MPYHSHRISRPASGAFFTLLLVGVAACSSSSDNGSATGPAVTFDESPTSSLLAPVEFAEYLHQNPDIPVVNVHVPYEGHIEGTDAFVNFETIATWKDLPDDLDAPIVLYCRSGNMSSQAAADLAALGYTSIVDLEGGMNAWAAVDFELLDDPRAAIE